MGLGAFDLHAPELAVGAVADEDVDGIAFSPELGDREIEAASASDEGGLGGFSAALAVGVGHGADGDDRLWARLTNGLGWIWVHKLKKRSWWAAAPIAPWILIFSGPEMRKARPRGLRFV
jgi:hypothetical protein